MDLENKLKIGNGIYTIPEISKILKLPYHKVNFWVNNYWDGELGRIFQSKYSWTINNTKAVSFHTLIEFYVLYLFAESGVKTRKVLDAHKELTSDFDTPFPFAQKQILKNIRTDGNKIYIDLNRIIVSLDGTKQLNLNFIKIFFKNLEFNNELLATKFWPMGREKNIVLDPKRQFGHPVVGNSNIYPETLYNLYISGEPIKFIAYSFEINEVMVKDAIEFCKAA